MNTQSLRGVTDPHLLGRLVDLSVTLNSTLELGPLLHALLTTAAELLDCEKASILLYNEQRGDLSFMSATGADVDQLAEIPVPLEGSLAGTIYRTGETLIINDAANDPRHFKKVGDKTGFQTRSLLGVPMRRRGQTVGVLEALNKLRGEFDEADAQVLDVIATQAAVAWHNAHLLHELRRAHEELSQVDKIKTNFMHLASHELRTPLAIIMSYAEFLKLDAQGASSGYAAKVLEAALQQRKIIEQMTNMDMLLSGEGLLQLASKDLRTFVEAACTEFQPQAEAKQQRLTLALADEPLDVQADADRLPLVFQSVLDNAVRFTPAGGSIEVSVRRDGKEARVSIRDTGRGIPAGELTNIFKGFHQVEDHMTRRHGGLGLGLAFARRAIGLHRGRIWAESAGPDQGATIHVTVPLANP